MTGVTSRVRREPPRFLRARVSTMGALGPRLTRVTIAGDELRGMAMYEPAASVRLLLPRRGGVELEMPEWNGNEFLHADGARPAIRTLTPRRLEDAQLDIDIVRHGGGALGAWLEVADVGAPVAVSGPGRGYEIDPTAPEIVLAGDESAIPAISQLLELLPRAMTPIVRIEVSHPDGRIALPVHEHADVEWTDLPADAPPGEALVAAVTTLDLSSDARVWAAGEAAAVQRIRKHLFEERGFERRRCTVRGYWKHGRAGTGDD